MFIDEEDIVLEAGVEVWLKAQMDDHRVMVAIDVSIYAVHPLEDLANKTGEGLWKWDACVIHISTTFRRRVGNQAHLIDWGTSARCRCYPAPNS
jgi:hypothetical protein